MRTQSVLSQLPDCFALNANSLRSLALICKGSPLITDTLLESIAPLLSNLDHFYIAGCPELETRGVWALISTNKRGLLSLGLAELSTHFDLEALSLLSASHTPHPLRRLRSITLNTSSSPLFGTTATTLLPETFTNLLGSCPLERFQMYHTMLLDPVLKPFPQMELLLRHIAQSHGKTLRRFSVYNILTSFDTIQVICNLCHGLEELFVFLEPLPMERLATALSLLKSLHTVHAVGRQHATPWLPSERSIILMLKQCSTITQFGWNSTVWEVKRTVSCEEGVQCVQLLAKDGNPFNPPHFLVQVVV